MATQQPPTCRICGQPLEGTAALDPFPPDVMKPSYLHPRCLPAARTQEVESDRRVRDAAHSLLAACEAIVAGWGHQDGVSRAVELARAAIALARGQQPSSS